MLSLGWRSSRLMGVVNFAHGRSMRWAHSQRAQPAASGINYWAALALSPLLVGLLGILAERLFLRHIYRLEPLYGLVAHLRPGAGDRGSAAPVLRSSGQSYPVPPALRGVFNLGS